MRESSKKAKKQKAKITILIALAILLFTGGGLFVQMQSRQQQNLPQTDGLTIYFFDVGQGDSTFIVLPSGETILIDAGETTTSSIVIESIKSTGTRSIDHVIATHPHSDHIGGLADVINAFEVKNIWMPDVTHTTRTFENLLDAIEDNGLSISIAESGTVLINSTGGEHLRAEFIAPVSSGYDDLNNYSAVLSLSYNNARFLFMGDAEEISEAEMLALNRDISADVIKIGHHGSSTSSTREFVTAVSPTFAIISCGAGNQYGHPHNETLLLLDDLNITILRTDEHGMITFVTDGENISYSLSRGD